MKAGPNVAVVLVAVFAVGCGKDPPTSLEVAQRYVAAIEARDWKAACELSVHEDMKACVSLPREVYDDNATKVPTVERTEKVVEEVNGHKLVHLEYTVIR